MQFLEQFFDVKLILPDLLFATWIFGELMSTGEAELDTALATDKSAPLDLLNPDSALGTLPEVHPNHLLLLFALNARTFMENVGASFAMNTPTSVAFT